MVEPLIDKSGFPRNDIDLVAVRTARSKIIGKVKFRRIKIFSASTIHNIYFLVNSITK